MLAMKLLITFLGEGRRWVLALGLIPFAHLSLCVATAGVAPRQGAYRSEEVTKHGIELSVPRRYETVPPQPNEKFIVRSYFGEPPKNKKGVRSGPRPRMLLVVIPKSEDKKEGRTSSDGAAKFEGEVINSFPRFFGQAFVVETEDSRGWTLGDRRIQKPRKGMQRSEYASRLKHRGQDLQGVAYCLEDDERIIAVYGYCSPEIFKKQNKVWKRVADKLELVERRVEADPKWLRFYERRKKFKDPEFRIKLRGELAPGWKADDTENFIFLYSTKDEKLIRILKRELEAIRDSYLETFPPAEEIKAVSAVRVCKDQEEYHQYGGPIRSAGYWNARAKELVFYDQGKGEGREDSRIVLYHEAFHQYIYYSAGEVAPHSWFNEGYGDYFSGTRFSRTGDIAKVGLNPWRIETIKRYVDTDNYVPFEDILSFEQSRFYADARRCYAQAWSMIYFLRESKKVRANGRWRRILSTYFEALKETFEAEQAKLEEGREGDPEELTEEEQALSPQARITKKAREVALQRAFEGVDLVGLEIAWLDFMKKIKL